jgi:hypothetical protein
MRKSVVGGVLIALLVFASLAAHVAAEEPKLKGALQQDKVIAGGPKEFMEVRHLVLKGTNEEIGRALALMAKERYNAQPIPSEDPFRTRVQRRYIEKQYPILFDRMRGAAAAFSRRVDDDTANFTSLMYLFGSGPGCSVVHIPPAMTNDGNSIVSRNYDFSTGTLFGTQPPKGELPCTARPYLVEMHPERGYASLAMYSYDLLSGSLDGINSEGLTVALLADDELMGKFKMEPAGMDGVGLGVLQMLRLLLDTCATVDEAKETLLMTKQYYEIVPVHFLVADRNGQSFVWEYSQAHNKEYIIENPGKPLLTTNFSLNRHLSEGKPPSAELAKPLCGRYCALCEHIAKKGDKLTLDSIKEAHKVADITVTPKDPGQVPTRTLWHALYVPGQRKLQISFYLHDEPNSKAPGAVRIVRSEYLEFVLKGEKRNKD